MAVYFITAVPLEEIGYSWAGTDLVTYVEKLSYEYIEYEILLGPSNRGVWQMSENRRLS